MLDTPQSNVTLFQTAASAISRAEFNAIIDNLDRRSIRFYPEFKAALRRLPRQERYEAAMYTYDSTKGAYPHVGILVQAFFALRHAPINNKEDALRRLEYLAPFRTGFRDALTRRVNSIA